MIKDALLYKRNGYETERNEFFKTILKSSFSPTTEQFSKQNSRGCVW